MAGGGDDADDQRKRKKEVDVAKRTDQRMETSRTGFGLADWCFNAALLVKDCVDEVEPESGALQRMMEAIYSAAHVLNDDNWRRFNELVWDRVHCQDHEVHGALFAKVEPTWRALLTTPKGGTTCVFLHVGTEPPSGTLCNLLTKLGWFGVSICPMAPEPGNEDLIQHINLDPGHDKDRDEFVALVGRSGGQLPKPSQFLLGFVNCVFNPIDPEPDSDEELGHWGADAKKEEEESDTENFGEEEEDMKAKPSKMKPLPSWQRANWVTTPPAQEKEKASKASGYGLLGVTRYPDVRKRLRCLNTSLGLTLHRLKQGGSLVILWPGLPVHPSMFFITSSLRPLFARVHVVANEGIKTFETYILCVNFNREKANDSTPGEGGSAIKSFFDCAYRRPALDDVLLWTLTQTAETTEAFFGIGGSSKSKTYDELWDLYANKYKALATHLDIDIGKAKVDREKKQRSKAKAKPEAKAEPAKKEKAKAKSEPKPAAEPPPPAQPPAAPEAKAKAKASPKKQAAPEPAQAAPKKEEKKAEDAPAAEERPATVEAALQVAGDEEGVKRKKKKPEFKLNRSVPQLSCSLGAVSGSLGVTRKEPDRFIMAMEYPLIKYGMRVAERKVQVQPRRPVVGVSLAGDGVTGNQTMLNLGAQSMSATTLGQPLSADKAKIPGWNNTNPRIPSP